VNFLKVGWLGLFAFQLASFEKTLVDWVFQNSIDNVLEAVFLLLKFRLIFKPLQVH
jgi:hypothetical protein